MKLSIITINYNDVAGLKRTVDSVKKQTWIEYEHIIIDGGSSDGSEEYLQEHEQYFSYWVSEPDGGIYNAMNKGVLQAKGDYLLMLNTGDILHNEQVLHQVFHNTNRYEDIIYGDVDRESKGLVFTESIFPDSLSFGFLRNGMISHQAVFFKKSLHDEVGLYDETIKYGADWYFITLAVCKYNASYIHLKMKMAICNADGLTSSPKEFAAMATERTTVLRREFPGFIDDYLLFDKIEDSKLANKLKRGSSKVIDTAKGVVKKILK
ncbi:hypothetical protein FFWV33_12070 [Flavobacterium faecale]|uniref:Glycosyltransferase 2-like domain-containing protein n=1 Tax=Flavobacterium faecale TaxID=1355330 RepID=A0A2S1LEN9_9FLAO|nr:glycosyltransferase family 2 protein [Flavobacterium faecale]AWG22197.1 hypothetical protein FFWV33_12070 [Flavobacterium faecale]